MVALLQARELAQAELAAARKQIELDAAKAKEDLEQAAAIQGAVVDPSQVPGAEHISQYRPITLIDVIFKIISKAYATRLDPIANRIISPNQTAFIIGRNILDGPLALIEIIHTLRIKKQGGILLKLDFEKAYDRVNWEFLTEVLSCKGFDEGYIYQIIQLVSGGQTAICINGVVGPNQAAAEGHLWLGCLDPPSTTGMATYADGQMSGPSAYGPARPASRLTLGVSLPSA
ncbi:hypothetical protein QYE76_059809 [Lolium multiflorum]|uniref:Reverse transcriptase domain-containing protein n=1 Tax=Lolium multiflorum TaxID=4521 RepID=A0AAD8W5N6_LOLMU|nr:hypothetical protein QYE76_059809 [Lolium multiflorum]